MTNEAYEQTKLFKWAAFARNTYKELDLLYHIPNGGKRNQKRLLILSVKECMQVYRICVCRLQEENFTHFILN